MYGKMPEPIAIVGSACRFAGDATSPSKLWDLLRNPHDVRSEIPDSRFSANGFYHPDHGHHGRSNVKHAYLINEDLGLFDAEFFGVKPVEAKAVDPQQRCLVEVVYEVLRTLILCI
jgi:acyl transferase domain-containing protein